MIFLQFLTLFKIIISNEIDIPDLGRIGLCVKKYTSGEDCETTLWYSPKEVLGKVTTEFPWSSVLPNKGKTWKQKYFTTQIYFSRNIPDNESNKIITPHQRNPIYDLNSKDSPATKKET